MVTCLPLDLPVVEAVAEALGTGLAVALFLGPATFLADEGEGPGEHVHEVGQPVGVGRTVELPDVHHVILVLQHRRLQMEVEVEVELEMEMEVELEVEVGVVIKKVIQVYHKEVLSR